MVVYAVLSIIYDLRVYTEMHFLMFSELKVWQLASVFPFPQCCSSIGPMTKHFPDEFTR